MRRKEEKKEKDPIWRSIKLPLDSHEKMRKQNKRLEKKTFSKHFLF